jgi:hypothetical protein
MEVTAVILAVVAAVLLRVVMVASWAVVAVLTMAY